MNKIIKYSVALLNIIRLFPHLFLYYIYKVKNRKDVEVAIEHHFGQRKNGGLSFLYLMTYDKMYRNLFYHRIGKWSYLIKWLAPPYNCYTIGTYTKIGEGLLGIHPFATIINAKSIGDNFTIRNNVTIGDNNKDEKPTIGNNVTVNVHSVVFGNISIGDNVIIGAGTLIHKNVPSNCVVVGNPARIIKQDGRKVNINL